MCQSSNETLKAMQIKLEMEKARGQAVKISSGHQKLWLSYQQLDWLEVNYDVINIHIHHNSTKNTRSPARSTPDLLT